MPSGAHSPRIGGGPRMDSVGIDLHRKRSHIAVLNDQGEQLLSRRIVNDPQTFLELLAGIDGLSRIALEVTYRWSGSPACSRRPATSCTSPTRNAPRRSPPRASRTTRSTRGRPRSSQLFRTGLFPEAYIVPRTARPVAPPRRTDPDALGAREPRRLDPRQQGVQRPYSDMSGRAVCFQEALELADSPRRRLGSTGRRSPTSRARST